MELSDITAKVIFVMDPDDMSHIGTIVLTCPDVLCHSALILRMTGTFERYLMHTASIRND